MKATEKLFNKNSENKFICVGLDSDIEKLPNHLAKDPESVLTFNKEIIEATKEHAAAYKINFAFYEALGNLSFELIEKTLELIPENILTIADAKRGDIGNTSKKYAESVFDHFKFDSITLHPYMGKDSLEPFLEYENKLNFILALTSNPGAVDFELQNLDSGKKVFELIIEKVNDWNSRKNCGIVFGATKIDDLITQITNFQDLSVLLPGVGAQGGSLEDVINVFKNQNRKNFIINISRAIIFKDNSKDYSRNAEEEIIRLNKTVNNLIC